ncbi:MAG: DNA repair protein RecN [Thermodesulfobacteriota bacterium]
MLLDLSIRNFAIMDDVKLGFGPGLTAVTGETGAGKSILVNAVLLLLGGRASSRMVRSGASEAFLEAIFDVAGNDQVRQAMEQAGLDPAGELLVQREVSASDRHRLLLNGRLATMAMLEKITESLASVSGQHAHQSLLRPEHQLAVLDRFSDAALLRKEVEERYARTQEALHRLETLQEEGASAAQKRDYLLFIRDEIEKAEIGPGEDETLFQKKERLKNSQILFAAAAGAEEGLYAGDDPVCGRLADIERILSDAGRHDPELAARARVVSEARYALEDAARELSSYARSVTFDEAELVAVEERLSLLSRLKKKYGPELSDVLARLDQVRAELSCLSDFKETEKKARQELAEARQSLIAAARALSEKREQAAPLLGRSIQGELSALGMEKATFSVRLIPCPPPADPASPFRTKDRGIERQGLEKAAFFISPNTGEPEKPLRDIASGGELSRVVLSILAVLAGEDAVATVVFDEVDAGIGGAVADNVGRKLKDLSRQRQVIAITHLAQIARYADTHFYISKQEQDGRTISAANRLSQNERVAEIARMLSGDGKSKTSLAHARELLKAKE